MQTKYERRFSHGFNMLAGYTWERTLTDAGDLLSNGGVRGYRAPQIAGISYDRGLASFNINHSFVASGTYELPFGQGKAFLSDLHGPAQMLLGGWIANGILTLNSGPPQGIGCQTTTAADRVAMRTRWPGRPLSFGRSAHYYNPAAFTDPPVATTIGTSNLAPLGGSNTQVNGPGFRDLDFSSSRSLR